MQFSSAYPDPDLRRTLLGIMAEGIREANQVGSACWSVSLRGRGRYSNLVAGRIYVQSLQTDAVWLTLDPAELDVSVRRRLEDASDEIREDPFSSVPGLWECKLAPEQAAELWPVLRSAQLSAVRRAAESAERTPYYASFSDEVLDFLEQELGTTLPRPIYEGGGLTEERGKRLLDLVRVRFPAWTGFDDPRFVADEVEYKQEASRLARRRLSRSELDRLLAAEDYEGIKERLQEVGAAANLLFLAVPRSGDLSVIHQEDSLDGELARAVRDLLHGDVDAPARIDRWVSWLEDRGVASTHIKWTFATYFLFLLYPEEEFFVKPQATRTFLRLAGLEFGLSSRPDGATYRQLLDAQADLRARFEPSGPRDMIDLQSLVWVTAGQHDRLEKIRKADPVRRVASTWAEMRDQPWYRFLRRLRRRRAEELQELLADPLAIDLETFNRDVWVLESETRLDGMDVTGVYEGETKWDEARLNEMTAALDEGRLELRGNYVWKSATSLFAVMLKGGPPGDSPLRFLLRAVRGEGRAESGTDGIAEAALELARDEGVDLDSEETREAAGLLPELTVADVSDGLDPETAYRLLSLRRAIALLNGGDLGALEKAGRITEIPGFGESSGTGLVMMFHPDEFGVQNSKSRTAVERLELPAGDLETFQKSLAALKLALGAEDYLELDIALWLIDAGRVAVGAGPARADVWWVNQGSTFEQELGGGFIFAGAEGAAGQTLSHHERLRELARGNRLLHYADGAIQAVGTVDDTFREGPRPIESPEGPEGYIVPVSYRRLETPIPLGEIPEDWRTDFPEGFDAGPFDRSGSVKQGYLYALPSQFVERLEDRFPELHLSETRSAWVFQANPEFWNLAEELEKIAEGDEDEWVVKRYADAMAPGDTVYLWQSGPDAGIYATATLTGEARESDRPPPWQSEDEASGSVERVPFRYDRKLPAPLLREQLRDEPALREMHVLKAPQGTNFRLTPEEHRVLRELLQDRAGGYAAPEFGRIAAEIQRQGMRIPERLLRQYHIALRTRGFVILSGVSGTGKTWLTELYARAAGARYRLVPVAPNWTSNEDLLGHWNPIHQTYQHTEFSRFLLRAAEEWEEAGTRGVEARPHHLCLDEMNLARVEYYFARFLSAMEVRARGGNAAIELGPDDRVVLPPNLVFVGTVNVDETTHGFADKVFDRAQLIELPVPRELIETHLGSISCRAAVMEVWDAVEPIAPFAFRVVDEIRAYVGYAEELGVPWEEALDELLLQKVLPRLRGADLRAGEALDRLAELAAGRFPLTCAKASEMAERFREHGFTSYF